MRVCGEIMQVQSPRREILSFKLISEETLSRRARERTGKAELFAPLTRVMHIPTRSITARPPLLSLIHAAYITTFCYWSGSNRELNRS